MILLQRRLHSCSRVLTSHLRYRSSNWVFRNQWVKVTRRRETTCSGTGTNTDHELQETLQHETGLATFADHQYPRIDSFSESITKQQQNKKLAGSEAQELEADSDVSPDLDIKPQEEILLRPYQEECIQAVCTAIQEGHRRLGVSLATGSGKTVIFTKLIDRLQLDDHARTQSLILAHRRELVDQATRHCQDAYPHKTIEVEMAKSHASGSADITVASIASINSGDRLEKFDPTKFKLILVDEAHHIVAPMFMRMLDHFGLGKRNRMDQSPALVGVSATLSRTDGVRLSDALDLIVYHKDFVDLIQEKWLSAVKFTTVKTKNDLSKLKGNASRDFQTNELSAAVNNRESNELIVRTWRTRASERHSTLIFCVDLQHVADVTAVFRENGVDARFITSYTQQQVRKERIDGFRQGEFPVLLNCGICVEGTDIPVTDCVLIARPTKSRNLLQQMIGRGMRLHKDKKDCHVIDMVSALKAGVVSVPTLFGLDPDTIVENATVDDLKAKKDAEAEREREADVVARSDLPPARPSSNKVTFTEYDSVFDLIQDTWGDRHIRAISSLAWVCVGPDRYILTNVDGSWLTLRLAEDEKREDRWIVTITGKIKDSIRQRLSKKYAPYMKPKEIASAKDFASAVRAAHAYACKSFPLGTIDLSRRWRLEPASEGQLAFINRLRPLNDQLEASDITKGHATDMITKIKHGARGQFAQQNTARRRLEREQDKQSRASRLSESEQVKLGPLDPAFRRLQPNRRLSTP